jgi:membrane protease YdiL (CAAX protease family)
VLSAKPWKTDAILRLGMSVFVSMYAGLLTLAVLQAVRLPKITWMFYLMAAGAFGCLAVTLVLLRRRWELEHMMRRLTLLIGFFYVGLFLGAWAQKLVGPTGPSGIQMLVGVLSFQGAALYFIHQFLSEHHSDWMEAFGLRHQWRHALLAGVVLACLFLPVGWTLQWVSAETMVHLPKLHLKPEEQQAVQTMHQTSSWWNRFTLGAVTIFLVPPAEETLFRGILYPWIKQAGFPRLALWGTSILFATVHFNMVSFIPLAVLALALTLLYERTGNLLGPIMGHAMFNALNFARLCLLEKSLN